MPEPQAGPNPVHNVMLGNIGTAELFIILLAVLLVFGAKRIPEIARGLGKGIREFREATREISDELRLGDDPVRARRAPAPPNRQSAFERHANAAPAAVPIPSAPLASEGTPAPTPDPLQVPPARANATGHDPD